MVTKKFCDCCKNEITDDTRYELALSENLAGFKLKDAKEVCEACAELIFQSLENPETDDNQNLLEKLHDYSQ